MAEWTVTLRIDTSAWSADREYPLTNPMPGGWGHAWVTVADGEGHTIDIGYYPTDNAVLTPGALQVGDISHRATQDAAYTYPVSAGQAAQLLRQAAEIREHPGEYRVWDHNCLTVARDLIKSAGVSLPPITDGPVVGSVTAWKTGVPVDASWHDPAAYSHLLNASTEGHAARQLYDTTGSALSGGSALFTSELAPMLVEAEAQAAQASSTYIGEADDPGFVRGTTAPADTGTYVGEADDPGFVRGTTAPADTGTYVGEADDPGFVHGTTAPADTGTYVGEADDPGFVHGTTAPADTGSEVGDVGMYVGNVDTPGYEEGEATAEAETYAGDVGMVVGGSNQPGFLESEAVEAEAAADVEASLDTVNLESVDDVVEPEEKQGP
jgi:hypothetical protein